jgi:hypothetical protein
MICILRFLFRVDSISPLPRLEVDSILLLSSWLEAITLAG